MEKQAKPTTAVTFYILGSRDRAYAVSQFTLPGEQKFSGVLLEMKLTMNRYNGEEWDRLTKQVSAEAAKLGITEISGLESIPSELSDLDDPSGDQEPQRGFG